jgi:hypothetical protein
MCLHFSKFIQKGWYYLDDACHNDGINKNHCVFITKYSFITAISDDEKDFSTVITNQTNEDLEYDFEIENLRKTIQKLMCGFQLAQKNQITKIGKRIIL